jgi:orotate phosphoribosyltransferase
LLPIDGRFESFVSGIKATSYRDEGKPRIRLATGKLSRYSIDCKMGLADPEIRRLIGRLMVEKLSADLDQIEYVGGMDLGAYASIFSHGIGKT